VRETLFNWLANYIYDSRCLDLFAGSGALGFEAVSRGARHAVLVENDAKIAAKLSEQKELFKTSVIEIKHQNALSFLQTNQQHFDLVFLDPPFDSALLEQVIPLILEQQFLSIDGLIYVETPSVAEMTCIPTTLECIREKVSGEVRHALYRYHK